MSVNGDQLVCADGRMLVQVVPDVTTSEDAHWVAWWTTVRDYDDLYVKQRKGL